MFAVASTNSLALIDPSVIKRGVAATPESLPLPEQPICCAWRPDNSALCISSSSRIYKVDPTSSSIDEVFSTNEDIPIQSLVMKDSANLIFSQGSKVHILGFGGASRKSKILHTFESHNGSVNAIALSNDTTLLASTSSNAAHVHNLSLGSHTVLRGLPLTGQCIRTCTFHPHARTRLLLGIGKQFVAYDTTRPSAPIKTIDLGGDVSGEINAIACSPFSKSLVAASTSGGNVSLIDLDKETGLFRTLNLQVPLTSIAFSQEGSAVYLGTENGKLLIVDLRGLDKPPKSITISEAGSRIETMAIQRKKPKTTPDTDTRPPPRVAATVKPATYGTAGNTARIPLNGVTKFANRTPAKLTTQKQPPLKASPSLGRKPVTNKINESNPKKVFSPVRNLVNTSEDDDISVQLETLPGLGSRDKKENISNDPEVRPAMKVSPSPRVSRGSTMPVNLATRTAVQKPLKGQVDQAAPRRVRTLPSSRSREASAGQSITATSVSTRLAVPAKTSPLRQERARSLSSASRAASEAVSGVSSATKSSGTSTRCTSATSHSGPSRKLSSPIPPVPSSHQQTTHCRDSSRTPSPDLPDIHVGRLTPVSAATKRSGLAVLGLGTPEVKQWIEAGEGRASREKGKGKAVGFKDGYNSESDQEEEADRERSLVIQVSPQRTTVISDGWMPSPLRHHMPSSPSATSGSAHELLRTIVRDVMYDFQQESRDELIGLHLDLVKMGRSWKKELKELMEEYVGDLRGLREENHRLREENERLRRGY